MIIFGKYACHRLNISIRTFYWSCIVFGILASGIVPTHNEFDNNNIEDPGKNACCGNSTEHTNQSHRIEIGYKTTVVRNEYIVRFEKYDTPDVREQHIRNALNGSTALEWQVIKRNNPASDYPSDFDLVMIDENAPNTAMKALRSHPSIKSISPQRMVHRTLKYIPYSNSDNTTEATNDETSTEFDANRRFDDREEDEQILQELMDKLNINASPETNIEEISETEIVEESECEGVDCFKQFRRGLANVQNKQSHSSELPPGQNSSSFKSTANRHNNRRLLRAAIPRQLTSMLKADGLWNMHVTGNTFWSL